MRSALEELWHGNICPCDNRHEASAQAKELMAYITRHHDNLQETLTEAQKELLEKLNDCYSELCDINERETFVYAFRLGAKIAFEVMKFEPGA